MSETITVMFCSYCGQRTKITRQYYDKLKENYGIPQYCEDCGEYADHYAMLWNEDIGTVDDE